MSLDNYLYLRSVDEMEGHSQQISAQTDTLVKLVSSPLIHRVFEIGFNAGHSSDTFLRAKPDVSVVSCDISNRKCVQAGKKYIDITYPSRHTLLIGDSTLVVPQFSKDNPQVKFDIIFIDGGHEYETAMADLLNCKALAHENTIVIMDDVSELTNDKDTSWAIGPTRVWKELVQQRVIQEMGHETYNWGRGMSWGVYHSPTKI